MRGTPRRARGGREDLTGSSGRRYTPASPIRPMFPDEHTIPAMMRRSVRALPAACVVLGFLLATAATAAPAEKVQDLPPSIVPALE